MRAARVARFPGAESRIPNLTGAEAAAGRLRATPEWQAAGTVKANPDSAQLPVRQRAGGRQDRIYGRAAAGRAGAVLRPSALKSGRGTAVLLTVW